MYRAALSPAETTPAVREQLEPMVGLGDLLKTVDVDNSRKPTLRYCRTLAFADSPCSICVPRTRENIMPGCGRSVTVRGKNKGLSPYCALTPIFADRCRRLEVVNGTHK